MPRMEMDGQLDREARWMSTNEVAKGSSRESSIQPHPTQADSQVGIARMIAPRAGWDGGLSGPVLP